MSYRTIKIDWLPDSGKHWKTFTAVRLEAGRLWSWLVERHATARQQGGTWPTKAELQKEIKRQFPALHSQSAQQIVADFCEAIASAEALRKHGAPYEYPHKKSRYRQVIFTNQALIASAALSTNPALSTVFPYASNPPYPYFLGSQLQQVARLISAANSLGMKRQIFFCALGGFDSHTNQTGTVPTSTSNLGSGGSGGQGGLLAHLSQSMRAFYDEMSAQGMSDRVTTFTLSDFGRTLMPSGPSDAAVIGSDHAWGSHSLIMGGAVSGHAFYGTYPTLQLSGPSDADSRGRWIPTTAVEQYGATLAAWYGVPAADIPTVFPFLYRFSPNNLGFLS